MPDPTVVRATTTCSECGTTVIWEGTGTADSIDLSPLDQESSFVCDHWRDHGEAINEGWFNSVSGRASWGSVEAEVRRSPAR